MAPKLNVTSQSIMDRLRSMTQPASATASMPSTAAIDGILGGYQKAAAIPDPVLDGNNPDPLQDYLDAGNLTPFTPTTDTNLVYPKSHGQPFTPVGIPNDNNMHQPDPSKPFIVQKMLNYGKHPLDVARYWAHRFQDPNFNPTPVGNKVGDDYVPTYDFKNFDDFIKYGEKTTQLPKSAFTDENRGQIEPQDAISGGGGGGGSISPGSYSSGIASSPTGSYMSATPNLLQQYAASAYKPTPQSNPNMQNAIQSRLAQLRQPRSY